MKPHFLRGILINSDYAYRSFIKKGFHILPKLTVKSNDRRAKQPLDFKTLKKAKLLKVIKKTKFVCKLDISNMLIGDKDFYFSASLYIAKRMSKILSLSIDDYMKYKAGYKGAVTLWPKFMKHLKSLEYQVGVEPMSHTGIGYFLVGSADTTKIPKEIKFMTDFLQYMKKLEKVQINCPALGYSWYLDRLWRFEKYPGSIEKFSIYNAMCSENRVTASLAHLKKLKDLEIILKRLSPAELTKSVIDLITQVLQIETLTFYFEKALNLDASVCESIKLLKNLKKIKFEICSIEHENNLKVLQSLENCPLRSVNLKVFLRSYEEIMLIADFLNKKKDIESLRLELLTPGELEGSAENMKNLVRAIDNLENLSSFSLSVKPHTIFEDKVELLSEADLLFPILLSKKIPMKKFKISLNQPRISKEGFLGLLGLLRNSSSTLERLGIDVGEYQPQDSTEIMAIVEFVKGLKNIRALKLKSLNVCLRQLLADLTEALYALKFLRRFKLGDLAGDINGIAFTSGVKMILMKHGLQKFDCERSSDHISAMHMDLSEIRKVNPSFIKGPQKFMYLENKQKAQW